RSVGAKILVSGGGRCNVTNRRVGPRDFHGEGQGALGRILAGFDVEATISFFHEIGVPLREEENGKLFPRSGRARTVLDGLLAETRRLDVEVRTGTRVERIERGPEGFRLHTPRETLAVERVVLATGGRSLPKTGSDGAGYALASSLGHNVTPQSPALVPLVLAAGFHHGLSGVAVEVELVARLRAKALRLRGPLLFTHFGVSGPVVLDASRHWCQAEAAGLPCELGVSFLPGMDFRAAEEWLLEGARTNPSALLRARLSERMPASVAAALIAREGMADDTRLGRLTRDARRRLLSGALKWTLPVRESRGYNVAEVTAGGVPLVEVDPATMESRRAPGLFLVGEILDVDGRLGGFNFQWAWSSAWTAAGGLSRSV
ncbi:MAG TPA: aminoacetone oxidase family FAD-binding enzyme, partial [Vicinamibacteria bacterium]